MGRRNGYGTGKSRSQRLGLRKAGKGEGAIQLREQELTAEGAYRDTIPKKAAGGTRRERDRELGEDQDGLGSLAGSPTSPRSPSGGRNYFRDELKRQEERK